MPSRNGHGQRHQGQGRLPGRLGAGLILGEPGDDGLGIDGLGQGRVRLPGLPDLVGSGGTGLGQQE